MYWQSTYGLGKRSPVLYSATHGLKRIILMATIQEVVQGRRDKRN